MKRLKYYAKEYLRRIGVALRISLKKGHIVWCVYLISPRTANSVVNVKELMDDLGKLYKTAKIYPYGDGVNEAL